MCEEQIAGTTIRNNTITANINVVRDIKSGLSMEASISICTNLALRQLSAAHYFALEIKHLESENKGNQFGNFWNEIFHHSLAVIMLSVSALESHANEFLVHHHHLSSHPLLKPKTKTKIGEKIINLIDMANIIDKYEIILAMSTEKKLSLGIENTQDIQILIELRNAITHFKPEWDHQREKHYALSKKLKNKCQPSQFLPNQPLFPNAWASYNSTKWAVNSVIRFLKYFYSKLEIESPKNLLQELS